MGRHKKHFTDEEKKEANRKKSLAFYWRNKEKMDKKAREYYWKKKVGASEAHLPPDIHEEELGYIPHEQQKVA